MQDLLLSLATVHATPALLLRRHNGTDPTDEQTLPLTPGRHTALGAQWEIAIDIAPAAHGRQLRVRLVLRDGTANQLALGLRFTFANWSRANFLLLPAAVYAGNRFTRVNRLRTRSAFQGAPEDQWLLGIGSEATLIADNLPHLALDHGPSRIQQRVGDLATPTAAIHFPALARAFMVSTPQQNALGLYGFFFEEAPGRTSATLDLITPCVRHGDHGRAKGDRAADLRPGDTVEFDVNIEALPVPAIADLYAALFDRRADHRIARTCHQIPFSACFEIQEDKYNRQNWVDEYGYYSVGMREVASQNWQPAWTGGLNAVYPLLAEGDDQTRARVLRTFDFIFAHSISPAGLLRSHFHEGKFHEGRTSLMRYHADALYFLAREYDLLRRLHSPPPTDEWDTGFRNLADVFVRLWQTFGTFGHRADHETGALVWSGTVSASTAPGGLALASRYFDEPRYLAVAEAAAEHYVRDYLLARGFTNAGPGDALQAPDSESAFGLLESLVTLYEITQNPRYLAWAQHAAHYAATWVMTYDFTFPANSTFARLDMLTTGTIFANIQNKHSAPGICSLSGSSLLRLFRYTADRRYLDLLRDIAHAIPQYMSRADRPITDRRPNQRWPVLDPGWINERVNTSDWEVRQDPDHEIGIGEIFGGSTWSEVALLLTYAELPGVYYQPDTGLLCALDHVDARIDNGQLLLTNPTAFPADVKLLIETSTDARTPWDHLQTLTCPRIHIAAGQSVRQALSPAAANAGGRP